MGLLRGEQTKIILKKCKKHDPENRPPFGDACSRDYVMSSAVTRFACYCCAAAAAASTHFLTSSTTGTL